ncbi:MAG TPA: GNAT family protein [Clostridia bacterium]|nr:GNAT family protein [Clostridia bacterium]
MDSLFESEHLIIRPAIKEEIHWIMALEQKDENKNFVFQGSYEDHLNEIQEASTDLCIIEEKNTHNSIGYFIGAYDESNDSYEFRRFVMDFKGKGYGTEVTNALMKYAFGTLRVNRFWLDVFTYNTKGIHIYEKLGLQRDGIVREGYKDGDVYKSYYLYSILKDEYETINSL